MIGRLWRWLLHSWRSQHERWLLGGAALALAVGFLQPAMPWRRAVFEHVVVLDITQSMNVKDMQLDGHAVGRLAFAKQALRRSLLTLPCGSRIGWAVFTEYRSFLLVAPIEVCANLDELRSTLESIDGRMAWVGGSEIAKGLHSALGIAKLLPGTPSLVFITDGHEAPPLNPNFRPSFDDKPGAVPGLLVGVGATTPSPIPKTDAAGRPLGVWGADEVQQRDLRSGTRDVGVTAPLPVLGATPGSEHLSSLHEAYLRLLAGDLGLGFHRLDSADALAAALTAAPLARTVAVRADARHALAGLALLMLLARHVRRPQFKQGNQGAPATGAVDAR
jgi:mxaL protein